MQTFAALLMFQPIGTSSCHLLNSRSTLESVQLDSVQFNEATDLMTILNWWLARRLLLPVPSPSLVPHPKY